MADAAVSFALENSLRLVIHEANLLRGVEEKVESLRSVLGMMSVFLKSCEQNKSMKDIEHEVVRQITNIAHEAEDVIDTFAANVVKNRRRSWLSRMLHGVDHVKLLHDVAEKIDNINARLKVIHDNKMKYDNQEVVAGSSIDQELQLLHKRRREVEEDDVVGFQHDSTEVINLLKQGGSRRNVVSIIGMGGLGKTTLARKVYNNNHVKMYFECHAWVYVSNDYRPRELLLSLLKCLVSFSANRIRKHKKKSKGKGKAQSHDDFYSLSEQELRDKVRECLKGKRYLVVLDDIWNTQHWDDLQYAFPDDNKRSRILITSRLGEVASHASSSPPYHLPSLNEEESWELFSKKVFRGEDIPSDLKPLGKRMVTSCRGLPLSIVVLARILAKKDKSYREWYKIMSHVNSYLTQPETRVRDIVLKLSYDSLPSRLRPCFLYFGMFPEDYEIPVTRLIHLWVAEGFILHSDSRIAEDVAEDYLDELIDRCLVQVGRRSDGAIKTCRIHDLLRDLCISVSKEENVFEVCRGADMLEQTKPRRISIQCNMSVILDSSTKDHLGSRSVLYFDQNSYKLDSNKSKRLVEWFQLVRVLDLGFLSFYRNKMPTNLNMLVHLRYLRIDPKETWLSKQGVREIPKFMYNLWNLETLNLGSSKLIIAKSISFPSGMWKLKRLRHLHTSGPVILPKFPDVETKTMWNLQTLSCVAINKRSAIGSLIGKGVFPKLRRLGLIFKDGLRKQGVRQVWENLSKLNYLNVLKIHGFLHIPTSVDAFPLSLTKITIKATNVNSDVMSTLGSLTNLRILKLFGCRCESELNCNNGFHQLVSFQMTLMYSLRKWLIGKDVMPCLTSLIVVECNSLEALPHELWSLTSLREVQVGAPSESVKTQLRSQPMRDACNLLISSKGFFDGEIERLSELGIMEFNNL